MAVLKVLSDRSGPQADFSTPLYWSHCKYQPNVTSETIYSHEVRLALRLALKCSIKNSDDFINPLAYYFL